MKHSTQIQANNCPHRPAHSPAASRQCLGARGEDAVAQHCAQQGWQVLTRNWRTPRGELDLVIRDTDCVAAVEVKTRAGHGFGHPLEAVTPHKMANLRQLLISWLRQHPQRGVTALRIDVAAVTVAAGSIHSIEYLRGAHDD